MIYQKILPLFYGLNMVNDLILYEVLSYFTLFLHALSCSTLYIISTNQPRHLLSEVQKIQIDSYSERESWNKGYVKFHVTAERGHRVG